VRDLLRFASCSGGEEVDLRTTVQIGVGWFSSLFSPVPIPFCFYFIFFWFCDVFWFLFMEIGGGGGSVSAQPEVVLICDGGDEGWWCLRQC
jgi:hypothetical protein